MSRGLRRWIVALACTANGVAATAGGATPVFEQPLQSVRIGSQPQGISIFDMDGDGYGGDPSQVVRTCGYYTTGADLTSA